MNCGYQCLAIGNEEELDILECKNVRDGNGETIVYDLPAIELKSCQLGQSIARSRCDAIVGPIAISENRSVDCLKPIALSISHEIKLVGVTIHSV